MPCVRANETICVGINDTYVQANGDAIALDFTNVIGSATIASVDSVTVSPSTGLDLQNEVVNSASYTDGDGYTIDASHAVYVDKVAGSTAGQYEVRVVVTLSTGSDRDGEFVFEVE